MLVLHYTGMTTAAAALERLCDLDVRVSAHYVVEENGVIWRLVPENRRAFHAGVSCWEGERDLNAVSLGIEIVNPGHEWGYRPFPEAQMASVEALCRDLVCPPFDPAAPGGRPFGHCAGAQERSRRIVRLGRDSPAPASEFGHQRCRHLEGFEINPAESLGNLSSIGYCAKADLQTPALAAFQRRFRQRCCDGRLDAETAVRLSEVREAFARSRDAAGRPLTRRASRLPAAHANKSSCPKPSPKQAPR